MLEIKNIGKNYKKQLTYTYVYGIIKSMKGGKLMGKKKKKPKRKLEDVKIIVEIMALIVNTVFAIYTILKG